MLLAQRAAGPTSATPPCSLGCCPTAQRLRAPAGCSGGAAQRLRALGSRSIACTATESHKDVFPYSLTKPDAPSRLQVIMRASAHAHRLIACCIPLWSNKPLLHHALYARSKRSVTQLARFYACYLCEVCANTFSMVLQLMWHFRAQHASNHMLCHDLTTRAPLLQILQLLHNDLLTRTRACCGPHMDAAGDAEFCVQRLRETMPPFTLIGEGRIGGAIYDMGGCQDVSQFAAHGY